MIGESVLDDLKREHEAVLARLCALIEEVERVEAGSVELTQEMLAACRESVRSLHKVFVDHRCREEVGLFPDVEQIVSRGAPRVDILRAFFEGEADDDIAAHVAIEARLKEIEALLERMLQGEEVGPALGDTARAMVDLLTRHATKEDTEVFPVMVRVLSEEQLAGVAKRLTELCEISSESET